MQSIFLDYNSTTPVAGCVKEAMLPFYTKFFGDPSSDHWTGRVAQEAIEDARCAVAKLIGCHPTEIVFTSGATESNNLALLGAASVIESQLPSERHHLILSSIEHAAVDRCAERLIRFGWEITRVGCDESGVINLDQLANAIRKETRIVSVMHANHDVGSIQPISEISNLCRGNQILLHTDASQTAGRVEFSVNELGVDLLSLSGHKMYAPKGIGALYIRNGVQIESQIIGDWQESGFRAGMENVPHIVGLGAACGLVSAGLEASISRHHALREELIHKIERQIGAPIVSHAAEARRLSNTASIVLPNRNALQIIQRIPELCLGPVGHTGNLDDAGGMSKTLAEMGLSTRIAASSLRVSVGWNTTQDEIESAANLISIAYEQSGPIT